MTQDMQAEALKKMAALEKWLAPIFAKFPHLPQNARTTLVQIAPWLALIFGVLGLFGIFSAGLFVSLLSLSFLGYGFMGISMALSLIAGLIAAVLDLLAYQPLSHRKKKGWNLLFYGVILSLAASILAFIANSSGSFGSIIGGIIGLWLLF